MSIVIKEENLRAVFRMNIAWVNSYNNLLFISSIIDFLK